MIECDCGFKASVKTDKDKLDYEIDLWLKHCWQKHLKGWKKEEKEGGE